ncbi:PREDICTED: cellular tumor antigen p53 [Nicrophorus vespilloides]|uniref:Cellular tumor antigen p53 n=1 Tax=Nicrophorus vespilloides TaxID=110193 RepID=A0ABM1NGF9_NICVS|nr:PREDICTED: cellular tumor antigen p53 [Nicrophorus vespilloides]
MNNQDQAMSTQDSFSDLAVLLPNHGSFDLVSHITSPEDTNFASDILETMLQMKQEVVETPQIISKEYYKGDYDFELEIPPNHGTKAQWAFSSPLNKLFILMHQRFPVYFKCNRSQERLYVRATPIYSNDQFSQDIVHRCLGHSQESEASNRDVAPDVIQHIIRVHSPGAEYVGSKSAKKTLSVVFPLGELQAGDNCHRHNFEFFCKNSCPTGMDRKSIDVIFTLENEFGVIRGRQTIGARICSCPKRDKDKEETDFYGKRAPKQLTSVPNGKKRKQATATEDSDKIYNLQLRIAGKDNYEECLRLVHDHMLGSIDRQGHTQNKARCLQEIKKKIASRSE